MPDDTQNDRIELSRRKIPGGTGAIGIAGLGAGLGTTALFSNGEQFANNQLVAGELDIKVGWEEHYFRDQAAARRYADWKDGELVIGNEEKFMDATLLEQCRGQVAGSGYGGQGYRQFGYGGVSP
jgi:hypothetical protein